MKLEKWRSRTKLTFWTLVVDHPLFASLFLRAIIHIFIQVIFPKIIKYLDKFELLNFSMSPQVLREKQSQKTFARRQETKIVSQLKFINFCL